MEILLATKAPGGNTSPLKAGYNFDQNRSTGVTTLSFSNLANNVVAPPTALNGYSKAFYVNNFISVISPANGFDIGTGDFTLEMPIYVASATSAYSYFFYQANSNSTIGIAISLGDSGYGNRLRFKTTSQSGSDYAINVTRSQLVNSWHHIALVRRSGRLYAYVDGVNYKFAEGTGTSFTLDSVASTQNLSGITSSTLGFAPSSLYARAYIPEIAFWNYAKYTSNFTPSYPLAT